MAITMSSAHSPSFSHFTYVTAHSDSSSFPSLHLRNSSFANPSLALPTQQLILQTFRCFTYITAHSPTLLSPLLRHRIFTYVTWRAAHAIHSTHVSVSHDQSVPQMRCYGREVPEDQRGLEVQKQCPSQIPTRKKSQGVKSGDLGGQRIKATSSYLKRPIIMKMSRTAILLKHVIATVFIHLWHQPILHHVCYLLLLRFLRNYVINFNVVAHRVNKAILFF